jgi:hypothetical protein
MLLAGCGRFGFSSSDDAESDADALPPTAMAISAPMFQTTSQTFVPIPGAALTIPPSPGTSWILVVAATIDSVTLGRPSVEARYLVDGVEAGMGGTQCSATDTPGPWQSFHVIEGSTTPHEVTFELREAEGQVGSLATLDAIAVPLPTSALAYRSVEGTHDVTWLTRSVDTMLSLGPLTGDYVVLLGFNITDAPGQSDCYADWVDPAGEEWLEEVHQPREVWQSELAIHRTMLDAADAQVTLFSHGGGDVCGVRDVRALAVRADAFASIAYARSPAHATSASPVPSTTLTLAPEPSSAAQFLYMGSIQLDEDCTVVTDALRDAHFTIDSAERVIRHSTDNCSYTASYGAASLLPSQPGSLALSFDSGNAYPVEHLASELLLLGLR